MPKSYEQLTYGPNDNTKLKTELIRSALKRISDGSTLVYQILTVATTTTIKAFTPNIYSQPHKSLFSIQLYYLRAHQLREKHD